MSANTFTFAPFDIDTTSIAVTQSSGTTAITLPGADAAPPGALNVRIYNAGSAVAYVRFGDSSITATTAKVPIPPGAVEIFAFGGCTHIAAIADTGLTTTLKITPGRGA